MHIFSRILLPFLLLGYIATETYLKLQHSSLCDAQGCKLAGELLKFDSLYLNYFGMLGVLVLIILGFLSLKNEKAKHLFFVLLYGAIAFEASILIYQFIANPEPCIFCMGIFGSLLVISLFSQYKNFLMVLAIVAAIGVALNTLAINKNQSYVIANGTYLIQSATCPHCKKVKAYFAKEKIDYTPISASEVNARSFLKFVNINSIPVLVVKDASGIRIIQGDHRIIASYAKKPQTTQSSQAVPSTTSSSEYNPLEDKAFLTKGAHDEGCSLTITETAPCASDVNKSH